MSTRTQAEIDRNIAVHDRISRQYDSLHGEIFNNLEQSRLRCALGQAVSLVRSPHVPLRGLDFGCGSGNLSRHMLNLEVDVLAADVSQGFLDLVDHRFNGRRIETIRIDGHGLGNIQSDSRDLVATYSVLHHIPDYLGAVKELARVCAPGGVVFIDHEPPDTFWNDDPVYAQLQREALRFDWRKYLVISNYVAKIRRVRNPRYSNEGDIHVWRDDHIEWNEIDFLLSSLGLDCVYSDDYLLFRKLYRHEVYKNFVGRCTDMRTRIYRKR